jgi:hypothetical protein
MAGSASRSAYTARVRILLSSRSHTTELATAPHVSQSPAVRLTVENDSWRKGTYTTATCSSSDKTTAPHNQ